MTALPLAGASFFVPGIPRPQGSMRNVGGHMIANNYDVLKAWRAQVKLNGRNAWAGRPPIIHPCRIDLRFYVPLSRAHRPGFAEYNAETGRNDADKLIRAVFDGLTEAKIWQDDALCVDVHAVKYRSNPPTNPAGVWIDVWQLDPLEGIL